MITIAVLQISRGCWGEEEGQGRLLSPIHPFPFPPLSPALPGHSGRLAEPAGRRDAAHQGGGGPSLPHGTGPAGQNRLHGVPGVFAGPAEEVCVPPGKTTRFAPLFALFCVWSTISPANAKGRHRKNRPPFSFPFPSSCFIGENLP